MQRFFFLILIFFSVPVSRTLAQSTGTGRVEVVFCLDLSGSTNGLIDRFRDHFWDYTYALSKCNPQVSYRFGVVGFSRPSFRRETGYVKVLKDLTTDLEAVGNELFELKTSVEKGDQMVGHALAACGKNISWTADSSVLKILFMVGNGLVNEGGTDFRKAAQELQENGIIINALYCNTKTMSSLEVSGWKEIAEIGKGYFSSFSVRSNYYTTVAGVDLKRLHELNDSLNNTYVYYGPVGKERWQMMRELDRRIYNSNPEGYLYRSYFKISPLYQRKNSSWDLVDLLFVKGNFRFSDLDPAYLPETLRLAKEEDLRKLVLQCKAERTFLLSELKSLVATREKTEEEHSLNNKKMLTFDTLTLKILNTILEKKGYFCGAKSP